MNLAGGDNRPGRDSLRVQRGRRQDNPEKQGRLRDKYEGLLTNHHAETGEGRAGSEQARERKQLLTINVTAFGGSNHLEHYGKTSQGEEINKKCI